LQQRLRAALGPTSSWPRSYRYARLRLSRLPATPHSIALGLSIGVFVSFQPILGIQMLIACAIALVLGASCAASVAGTFAGSPLTWPFMWVASYELGAFVLGVDRNVSFDDLWNAFVGPGAAASTLSGGMTTTSVVFTRILQPLALGAIPLGLLAGGLTYLLTVFAMQRIRRHQAMARRG
ncbi:MAG: DUF2062 domain-containing protein, partial [Hyphomicrobiaceae bacterium]